LLILMCCSARADIATREPSARFENADELDTWANSAGTGALKTELNYKKHKLLVYSRSYTSGDYSSEPHVFVERKGKWVRVLTAMMCRSAMDASIEGHALILWRIEYSKGKSGLNSVGQATKVEYLRFDLRNLDEA